MLLKTISLTPEVLAIVQHKSTEKPFSGEYNTITTGGTYLCRQCGLALFRSQHQFHSGCGWPSFDNELPNAIYRLLDSDGIRTEILCARCNAHLGHAFEGEGFTKTNLRHCVNSLSLDFTPDEAATDTEEVIVAAGCFWGVEYYFQKLVGIVKTEVGYIGGSVSHPDYKQVCKGNTGHFEAIRLLYDTQKLTYAEVIRYFFEIHDFTQQDGQGPDLGDQYKSAIFYFNLTQKETVAQIIQLLKDKHFKVTTQLLPVSTFWRAENYHQQYYNKNKKSPYCHHYVKRFD